MIPSLSGLCPAIVLLLIFLSTVLSGQPVISGTVIDRNTSQPLPYSIVSLKKHLTGIAANAQGQFDLRISEKAMDDTLVVNVFGYNRYEVPVSKATSPIVVRMSQRAHEIEEVVVVPQPPEYYIREAMRRMKQNYAAQPFETVAFYREIVKENENFVQCDEAVFRTYCANYLDTTRNQDQLLLYRQADEIKKIAFMNEDRKTRRARRNGEDLPVQDTSKKEKVHLANSFGGPREILRSNKPGKSWFFLDTTRLRSFKYAFGGNTTFNDHEVMIIEFTSRGKVDHIRDHGRIFITRDDFAIVRIEDAGTFVIPVLIRPLLFTLGIGVTNPVYSRQTEFREADGRWFPQKVLFNLEADATKRHFFSPNEHSRFTIDQVFVVNELKTAGARHIAAAKRFDSSKPINGQVHNDGGHTWENVNVMRR